MIRMLIVACLGWVLSISAWAGDIDNDQAAAELSRLLGQLKSLNADFEQWVMDAKQNEMQHLTGEMWIQRPGHFRWDTDDPYPQQIVSDGESLWVYDVDLEQATQRKLDKQVGNTPALLLSGDPEKIDDNFSISAYLFKETGEWRFDLRPKDENAMFALLRVHFLNESLRDMYLEDNLGQTTRIEFKTRKKNEPMPEGIFDLKLDSSVDVIKDS